MRVFENKSGFTVEPETSVEKHAIREIAEHKLSVSVPTTSDYRQATCSHPVGQSRTTVS